MLDSLKIKNFRSLADFEVAKLGRVNLIVGKNNSGKSSVLEALRIYAGNGQESILKQISASRDETSNQKTVLSYQDFFTGRVFPGDLSAIQICPQFLNHNEEDYKDCLIIVYGLIEDLTPRGLLAGSDQNPSYRLNPPDSTDLNLTSSDRRPALQILKGKTVLSIIYLDDTSAIRTKTAYNLVDSILPCSVIPTQLLSPDELVEEWDYMDEIEDEEIVKQAMQIITPEFENLKFVGNKGSQRNAKVKLSSFPKYVPLKSLGDGMLRILQLSLKLVSAKGGFLLIDEFENGLHYSVQEKVWSLLFEMAQRLDIQVFATTHSWDCIESFAKVAHARQDVPGVLFRIGKSAKASDRGRVIATVYDAEELQTITQAEMEIR